jgi:hypothetical protein
MGAGERTEAWRAACARLGAALLSHGSTWMARLIGARLVESNAQTPDARLSAGKALAAVRAQTVACSRATGSILDGLESDDAATRAKAISEWDRWLRREAVVGEVRACEERVAASAGRR